MKRFSPTEFLAREKTVITAHSGCENTPPNSREHILAAIASRAEMIEFDVHAVNGELILSHDVPADPSACVTLRECFSMIAPEENLHMNIDVKTEGLLEPIMALAKEFPLEGRIIFTGACNSDRALALALGADVWRSMWPGTGVEISDGIRDSKEDGSPFLNVAYCMITEENNRELVENGFAFSAWTVDEELLLRHFLTMGLANITTRNPVLAMQLRKEIQGL